MKSIVDFRSADRPENIEGFGYHYIILNEAGIILKGKKGESLWLNSVLPMTMDFPCKCFIGGTPKGKRNKDGTDTYFYKMYKRAIEGDQKYYHCNITTDKNPFINDDAVEEVRLELPEGFYRDQEFYGKFIDEIKGFIKAEWFAIDEEKISGELSRSWDLAFSKKESADTTAGALCCRRGDKFQVQDIVELKEEWPLIKEFIINTALSDGVSVVINVETNGTQKGYTDDLKADKRLRNHTVKGFIPAEDKFARAMKWITKLSVGDVSLLRGLWNDSFKLECQGFTSDDSHDKDNKIDAVSIGFINSMKRSVSVRSV